MPPKKDINTTENEKVETLDSIIERLKKNRKIYGSRSGNDIKSQDIITTSRFEFEKSKEGGFRTGGW